MRDVVFKTLRQAILRGELKPGERLMEIKLANKLGVSRTPIREAIRKLELEGLVLMIPTQGAEVAEITEKNLEMCWKSEGHWKSWRFSWPASGWTKRDSGSVEESLRRSSKRPGQRGCHQIAEAMWRFMT